MRRWITLLVLVLVFLVTGGLLLTAIARARDAAHRLRCANNLKQIGLAIENYYDTYRRFPAAVMPNPDLPPAKRLSWLASLTPYLEGSNPIWPKLDPKKPWDAEENRFAALMVIRCYQCPVYPSEAPVSTFAATNYTGLVGLGPDAALLLTGDPRAGFFGYERTLTQKDVGESRCSLLVAAETSRVRDSWLAGGPATVRGLLPAEPPYLGVGGQFGSLHRDGTNALFADGSVRLLPYDTAPAAMEAWATVAGSKTAGQAGQQKD